jgi:hypothetical protein
MANETNPSQSALATVQKYLNADIFTTDTPSATGVAKGLGLKVPNFGERLVPGINAGAMPSPIPKPIINVTDISGKKQGNDLRVKIKVPSSYLTDATSGLDSELSVSKLHGIIFPYTPIISVDYKADYTTSNPLHSNFPINFYQRSTIGSISITGKFSVENSYDAAIFIATTRLLKALTKMRSGGYTGDPDSGSPPPVCRLSGHGEWMFNNVPVAISNVRIELPDSVDYYTMPENTVYEMTAVPTVSTIAVTCIPMYSRNEMLNFNVTDYVSNTNGFNKKGYL